MVEIIKEKKAIAIAVIAILLIAILLPLARCSSLSQVENKETASENDPTLSVVIPDDEEAVEVEQAIAISERQSEIISAYGSDEVELLGLLKANVWTANKDTNTIRFEENAYTESANNNSTTTSFAICGIESNTETLSGVNGESETTEDTTVTLMYEDGSYGLMHVKLIQSSSSPNPELTVNSSDFSKSKSYIRTKAANGLNVEGLNEEVKALIKNKTTELDEFLTEYCSIYYPTASVATWDQKVEANYNSNIVEMSFTLNNLGTSRIAVTYDLTYGEFGVGGM